jgi:hypothetical protein
MSVEFGIITSVVPPGNWHYPQVLSTGEIVRLGAFSFEEILQTMLDFRNRHLELCGGAAKATIEAVRSDLKTYLCKHFKQNCADSPGPAYAGSIGGSIGISKSMLYSRPIDKAADWLAKIGNLKIDQVDAALAASRAHICATCPQNVRWATGCAPCNENVEVRIQNAVGSVSTPYDRHLFVCRIFGHSNRVAVWLTDTNSTSEQQAPQVCWKVPHGIG